jgi:EAL domain-containing protein (putative c-di-GMP-specific phosphodiesterase class I)
VRRALRQSSLPAEVLTLEITESMLMRNVVATTARLADLSALGVQIAVDDMGTGHSSLAYLRQFPVNTVKIDRSFLADDSWENEAIIHTLVQLSKSLALETVAEGIETVQQLARMRREGCERGQGYLFSAPLPPAELDVWRANWRQSSPSGLLRSISSS